MSSPPISFGAGCSKGGSCGAIVQASVNVSRRLLVPISGCRTGLVRGRSKPVRVSVGPDLPA